ncbi:hypothetical protein LTS08_001694 [Lithohypha guttulata]|uniref:Zn(2)-C6 fungal-type domain-containing protein n=1 Tax=Lithohypha guttulata TaxID=1690604 RepID=A0AAN7SV14_9EURO|nr:hypothetical protein LTR51_003623 [Lithohypha guttulata]KAK5082128.1 hypothetical protein LTR05_007271 [Lithohypha guttulata]KAK5105417.1 hypothetical protein LTS08_001694 [Lithohypha guttulata]
MSDMLSTSQAATEIKKSGSAKPVKLRSACNSCFAAKVRCDGNKEGCKRCAEKKLQCTYSESMVGKVVGKRRKRPLPQSKFSDMSANPWAVNVGPATMPSPAPTNVSEPHNKRTCVPNDWGSLVQFDDQASLDFSICDEQFLNLDMCQTTETSVMPEVSYVMNVGLPTPSTSPPEMRFFSPTETEAAPSAIPINFGQAIDVTQQMSASTDEDDEEDDEARCIQLLAHVKRLSSREQLPYHALLSHVNRTNAVLRWLMRSSNIRTQYTCHLLLTAIMTHLTKSCEQLLARVEAGPEQEFLEESFLSENDDKPSPEQGQPSRQTGELQTEARTTLSETVAICVSIGNLLKRKPLNGFQVLGRQESALVDLERRLRAVIASS